MNHHLRANFFNISTAIFFLLLAYIIQSLGIVNGDAACILYNAKFVLAGGTYVKDFFETNPPLIFYLNIPVVLIAKFIPFNLFSVFRVYVLSLAAISIICSVKLLSKIFVQEDGFKFKGFIFILFFILLYLPASEFGQREHFFLIFMLPYLFYTVLVAQDKKIPGLFSGFIGLMAALGIGLKPYFLFPIIFVELYLIFIKRDLLAWIRVESVTCIIVLSLYLASVFIFDPEYIKIILPLVSHVYLDGVKEPYRIIFSQPPVLFCFFIWGCFFIFYRNKQRELTTILMLGLTGMMAAFLVPRVTWYYHIVPAFGISCLLAWLYCCYIIPEKIKRIIPAKIHDCIVSIMVIYVLIIPILFGYVYIYKAIFLKHFDDNHLLVAYINSLPSPHNIYCFSSNSTQNCFPLVQETHSQYAGRFPMIWWTCGVIRKEIELNGKPLPLIIERDKKYLIDAIANDLNQYKNTLIIINTLTEKRQLGDNFDPISYFSKNEEFRNAWKNYHYVKTIGIYQLYMRS